MRYTMIVAVLALASTALGADSSPSSIQKDTQVAAPTNSVTVEAKGYTFTIQTDKDTYDPGDKIVLAMKVKYAGATPVNFDTSPAPVFGSITVLYNGVPCPQTLFCKEALGNGFWYGTGVVAPPGWEHAFSYHLNRLFDMTRGGEYKIWIKRHVPDKQTPSGDAVVDCGPVTIHIDYGSGIIENK